MTGLLIRDTINIPSRCVRGREDLSYAPAVGHSLTKGGERHETYSFDQNSSFFDRALALRPGADDESVLTAWETGPSG